MAKGLKTPFYWGIAAGVGLTVLTSGIGGLTAGKQWGFSSFIGGVIAVTHLALVALGSKPGASSAGTVLAVGRLLVVGFLVFIALHQGVMAVPMTMGLASVYIGLLGGLLADHARHR